MTGFGRAEGTLDNWLWSVEARSVNGRNLEVRFRGPNGFEGLERKSKDLCTARFSRGQVGITVQAKRAEGTAHAKVNLEVLQRYLDLSNQLISQGDATTPSADGILALKGVLDLQEREEEPEFLARLEADILATCGLALDDLDQSRTAEGASLETVLRDLLSKIATCVDKAGVLAGEQTPILKDRFSQKMAELLGAAASEDRILQEAAILATKADVREEIDRLQSHIAGALQLIAGGVPCGRKLDFYMQEFMREANTLCSKSATTALTSVGLDLKTLIEQLREQVQNVE
jgi:uncharacterized protein (TIGR00255 family)